MGGSKAKTVKQYHFISWPDHGVPVKYHVFLEFLQVIMNDYNSIDGGVIVVHCRYKVYSIENFYESLFL